MDSPQASMSLDRDDRRFAELVAMLRRARPNVLIVGAAAEADRTFEVMHPYLRTPIASWVHREAPDLPKTPYRTLVIREVEALNPAQQESLVALICSLAGDVQVVSTTTAPLLPLVDRGVFLDRLYYQLNVVYLDLSSQAV
jgi:hypothetical protein